jgi:hypothetical protein
MERSNRAYVATVHTRQQACAGSGIIVRVIVCMRMASKSKEASRREPFGGACTRHNDTRNARLGR